MIAFTKKQNSEYDMESIVYAVKLAMAGGELRIEDLGDHRLGLECMAACGYPESDLCYDNIIDQMKKLGFDFVDWDDETFEFDESRYNRGFQCTALCALGETARRIYAEGEINHENT